MSTNATPSMVVAPANELTGIATCVHTFALMDATGTRAITAVPE